MEAKSSELIEVARCSSPSLRLLLDGRKLGDGGIGVYTYNLILGLLEIGGVDITVLYRDPRCTEEPFADRVAWLFDEARPYSLDETLLMPGRIDFSKYDLFHTPHYILPYRIPIPTVVTVHDIIHITHPEKFFYPWIARRLISSALRRADGVLAVSQHTREQLLSLVAGAERKIRVVPNAAPRQEVSTRTDRATIGRAESYFFTLLSNAKPHKGLVDLIRAYDDFRRKGRWGEVAPRCPELVIGGYGAEQIRLMPELERLVSAVDGVVVVGALSEGDRDAYTREALALVVPSLAEGFCIPALEAQACGTPVVCRPVPAILELATAEDCVADDFTVEALSGALLRGMARGVRGVREPKREHLKRFSRSTVASLVKSEYERVLARGGQR